MIWRLRPVIFLPAIPQHVENSVQNLAHVNRALRPPGLAGGIIGSTTAIRRRSDHSDNEEHCGQQQCDVQASTGPPANQAPTQNHNRFIGRNTFLDRL